MLEIRKGNDKLDLGKYSVNIELKSPLFNDEGSFSYPFTLPPTAKNKQLLNYPARVNNFITTNYGLWDIYINGMFWKKAGLVVTESNRDFIKIYLALDEGDMRTRMKDTKISDVDLGGKRFVSSYSSGSANGVFGLAYENLYPDQDFTLFPVQNFHFYKGSNYDEEFNPTIGVVNIYDESAKMNVDNNTFIPFVYFNYLVKRIFSHLDHSFKFNFFESVDEFLQMVIYNTVATNTYSESGGTYDIIKDNNFDLANHLPGVTIKEFFNIIEKTFSVFLFRDLFTNEVSLVRFQDILQNDKVNEITLPYRIVKLEPKSWDGYALEWNHDSGDNQHDGGLHGIDPKSIDISKYTFRGNRADGVGLAGTGILNDCYFLENTNRYAVKEYIYSGGSWGLNWNTSKANAYCDFIEGNGKLKINPGSSLVGWLALQEGNINKAPFKYNNFDVRFMLFRGMIEQNSPGGGTFLKPFGTAYSSYDGNEWDYGLQWHGSGGIYEHFWKYVIEFHRNKRRVELKMPADLTFLKNLNFQEKYRIANANWLLDSVKIQVSNDKISPAEVTAWKL